MFRKYFLSMATAFILLITVLFSAPAVFTPHPCNSDNTEGAELPILMYHHVLKDPSRHGTYVVSPDELEADFRYLKEQGYTTVSVDELIAFVHKGSPLPEKPILITFDDGHLSFCEYVLPLLIQYDMHAVLSVIGIHSDTFSKTPDPSVSYAHITWDDAKALQESGRVDIENHSYNLHTTAPRQGTKQMRGESDEVYRAMLTADLTKTQERIFAATDRPSKCFTYPFGHISKTAQPVLEQLGFEMSLSCREGINVLSSNPDCLFNLRRYNRPHGKSAATILASAK